MEFMLKNEIMYSNKKLLGREKRGLPYNQWSYVFVDGTEISGSNFCRRTQVEIKCHGTGSLCSRRFKESWFENEWFSQSFQSSGDKNGMFGKSHSDTVKKHFSSVRKGVVSRPQGTYSHSTEVKEKISKSMTGENNPFYGKSHSMESKSKISASKAGKYTGEDNPFYGKKHSQESIKKITLKGNKWREENPELSYEAGLRGWQNSIFSKVIYGRKTSIERKTEEKLKEFGVEDFNFSQVLGRKYQFDFRIGQNILLEVHGDYWHGSPKKYGFGPGLKPLNEQQQTKIAQDKIKQKYAIDNGWKLYVIWESDINNNNWTIIEELLNEI